MASGSFNIQRTGGSNYLSFRVDWSSSSNGTAANSSSVIVSVFVVKGSGSTSATWGTATTSASVTDGGIQYQNNLSFSVSPGKETLLFAKGYTVPHNANGTKSITISVNVGGDVMSASGSATVNLDTIPRQASITAAPNFNDEENPTISYNNPAGNSVTKLQACISFTGAQADISYRDIPKTGSSYTFELTDAERDILRNSIPNSNSRTVNFYVRTVLNNSTYYSYTERTLTIINGNPTLSAAVEDSNSKTIALTGDSSKLIKYYSTASYNIAAAAVKGATLSSTSATHSGITKTTATGIFSFVENGTFTFTAKDSRGNVSNATVTKSVVDYIKLSTNLSVKVTVDGNATLKVSGNYFNGNFGATANTIALQYRYKLKNGTYGNWTAATATVNDNTYSANIAVSGLNYKDTYVFQVQATDKLATVSSKEITANAKPVFDWGENDFNFGVDVSLDNNEAIYGTRPDGTKNVALEPCDSSGNTVLGYGSYNDGVGNTNIYGNNITISAKNKITINGKVVNNGARKVLWQGSLLMDASQSITLKEPISSQPNGAIFIFTGKTGVSAGYNSVNTFYVDKMSVGWAQAQSRGHTFIMGINSGFSKIGAKYLYLKYNDKTVVGDDTNKATGSNSGITFDNSFFYLRAIIGV